MNIVLIGFMGTGKSTVGRMLAEHLEWQFFDTDELIEKEVGVTISEIFARKGEPYFRDLETKTVKLLSMLDKSVIACGGGAVLRAENMEELEKNGIVVCLTASPEKILERTRAAGGRPLLEGGDPLAKIRDLLERRRAHYQRSQITLDTDSLSPDEAVKAVIKHPVIYSRLKKMGF